MKIPPIEVIQSWPPPRYDNPETRGPANEIVVIILLAIATITIAIRIYTRRHITNGFGWDDILVVLAFIPATGFVVLGMIALDHFGWGRHVWDVPTNMFTGSLQIGLASQILFDLATSSIKLSMLVLMYRIASEASNKLRLLVIGLQVFISVNCVVFILVAMMQCRPLYLYWTLSDEPQNCINEAAHLLVAGIINTATDFMVVLLPLVLVRVVFADKLSSRQMTIVNLLFGVGFLASFAGAARTYFTWIMTTEPDATWNAWMNWLMSSLELLLGIICASIPSTKPFFSRYIPKLLGSSLHKSKATSAPVPTDKAADGSVVGSQLSEYSKLKELEVLAAESQTSKPASAKRFSEATLNKPLPAVINTHSIYTIKIQLDEASLEPADRRRVPGNQKTDPSKIARRQGMHNFSRPNMYHTKSNTGPSSHDRSSVYGMGESRPEGRNTSTSGAGSRHRQILHGMDGMDGMDGIYHQSVDDLEAGIRYGTYDSSTYAAPTKKHARSGSVGTFGG